MQVAGTVAPEGEEKEDLRRVSLCVPPCVGHVIRGVVTWLIASSGFNICFFCPLYFCFSGTLVKVVSVPQWKCRTTILNNVGMQTHAGDRAYVRLMSSSPSPKNS
ncbi:hypothetical protein BDV29DRAFT_166363 [Aspergillus leporis]|uniref:Uncharacterized protein n=1 Tax=Aspergillus leporis TaxID=41062 RepID=A0A5N5XCM6_9EURO|nr:hypothetical protein BDV29DRAFT_166363 [Aspergillus leporis]